MEIYFLNMSTIMVVSHLVEREIYASKKNHKSLSIAYISRLNCVHSRIYLPIIYMSSWQIALLEAPRPIAIIRHNHS